MAGEGGGEGLEEGGLFEEGCGDAGVGAEAGLEELDEASAGGSGGGGLLGAVCDDEEGGGRAGAGGVGVVGVGGAVEGVLDDGSDAADGGRERQRARAGTPVELCGEFGVYEPAAPGHDGDDDDGAFGGGSDGVGETGGAEVEGGGDVGLG